MAVEVPCPVTTLQGVSLVLNIYKCSDWRYLSLFTVSGNWRFFLTLVTEQEDWRMVVGVL